MVRRVSRNRQEQRKQLVISLLVNDAFAMISTRYDIAKPPIQSLLRPVTNATAALTRLDERIARSSVGKGWIERSQFADACTSLWLDGELVHFEDFVLRDAARDVHVPAN